ncbi:MAG: hypothetical protein H0V09_09675 [Gemmatimonadetes bacterium]|nr:hypothetical protein [Gemmatimonadota bacterium]
MSSRLRRVLDLVEENPDEPLPRYMAGNELLNSGDAEGAVEHLIRYVEMLPGGDVGAAWRMLGRAYVALGREDEARSACEAGIRAALAHRHGDLAAAIEHDLESL